MKAFRSFIQAFNKKANLKFRNMVIGSIISWVIFSILVGVIGLNRKIGFWGAFFISLLLSPFIGLEIGRASCRERV